MRVVHSYSLHEPNQLTRGLYAKLLKRTISRDASIRKKLLVGFRASNKYNVGKMKASRLANAISHIAVRKLVSQILKQRKLCAGEFLNRGVGGNAITDRMWEGEGEGEMEGEGDLEGETNNK